MRRSNHQGTRAECRQPHTYPRASDADVHDLTQSLIVETWIRQSRDAEVRLMQCVAPGPDPVFAPSAFIVVGCLRKAGRLECADCEQQRKGQPTQRKPPLSIPSHRYLL